MAISFVLGNGTAWGSSHGYVQDGGKLPSVVRTGTGWTAGTKAAGQYSLLQWGSKRASTTFGSTAQPASAPTTNDCFRSVNSYRGTFAAASWSFSFALRSATAAYTGRGQLQVRVWKSANQDGSSATELTSGAFAVGPTTASLSTTVSTVITGTWTPGSTITLTDEYLFFQVAWDVTSAGGGTTQDVLFVTDSTNSVITTSTFTPSTTAYTRNIVASLPAAANGKDYVIADDQSTIMALQQDVNPSGSKDLFTIIFPATGTGTDAYYLAVSTDGGVSWSLLTASNGEPNADSGHQINLLALVQDDSAYKVHFVGKNINDANIWYSRITLAYTSGHITGWSWDVERQVAISPDQSGGQPNRVTLQRITDGNGVKRLMITALDNPSATTIVCRLIVAATTPSAGLAPTAAASWCKLTSSTSTNAFDILAAWSLTTTTDANAIVNYTSQTTNTNSYNNCCTAAQVGTNGDLHVFSGPYYYNDANAAPGTIRRWRLTASGSNWSNDGTVNGASVATDNGTNRPAIGAAIGRTNAVYLPYYDVTGVPLFFKVNSSGTTSAPFASMETATSGSLGYVAMSVSSDETQCWASYMTGFNVSPAQFRVAHYDGTKWAAKYDETLDWNNSATGEWTPLWPCQDVFDGVIVGSYQLADYSTTHHHNGVHVFRSAPTGGSGAALAASVSDAASVSASLTTGIQLAGAISDAASVSASLTTAIKLGASISDAAVVAGALTTAIQLGASIGDAAAVSAGLTTAIQLAAGIADAATVSGALTTAIKLGASVSDAAQVVAGLTTAIRLAVSVSDAASVSAALSTGIQLAAAVNDGASVSASLTTGIRLAAAINDAAVVTANLLAGGTFAASISDAAVVTAALTTGIQLGAVIADAAAVSASLSSGIRLAASVADAGAVSASLSTGILLAGSVSNSTVLSASLSTSILLAAQVQSAPVLSAALSTGILLSAAINDAAVVRGQINSFILPPPTLIGQRNRVYVPNPGKTKVNLQ